MNVRKYLITGCIVFLIMPLVACAKGSDLREVTTKARVATSEARSYRMKGTTRYTSDGETLETVFEGEFAAPDRFRAKMSPETRPWCEVIKIGDKEYVRTSDKAEWGGGKSDATCVVLPISEVLEPLDSLVDLEQLPEEHVGGVDCFHYCGKVDLDSLVEKTGMGYQQTPESLEVMLRASMDIELWVGKDDYLIRQMITRGRFPELEPGVGEEKWATQNTIMRFYDFNKPIAIEPP